MIISVSIAIDKLILHIVYSSIFTAHKKHARFHVFCLIREYLKVMSFMAFFL